MRTVIWPLCCLAGVALSLLDARAAVLAAVAGFLAGRLAPRATPVLAVFGLCLGVAAVLLALPGWTAWGSRLVNVALLATLLPWLGGRVWRQSRELARAGWERAERLAAEQQLVRLRERAAIAQDMHDVLGHELSLLALRAAALKVAPGLAAEHREAAGELRTAAADAVDRLGEVIGLLRDPSAGDPPQTVDALVERAESSGLEVSLVVEGSRADPPAIVERTAVRVVQECLTNVAKHAPGVRAEVLVAYGAGELRVVVHNDNDLPAPADTGSGGSGLPGLRERVRLVGGRLEHGRVDGRFEVSAVLPYSVAPVPVDEPPAAAGPVGQARRRFRRDLVLAVGLPVAGLVLLAGGLKAWTTYLTAESVLSPSTFAGLRAGQERAAVERLLPERQAPERPAGSACSYYAMTADPTDDRSGDLYQLCWRGTLLASATVMRS